jgi:hypothetical protein
MKEDTMTSTIDGGDPSQVRAAIQAMGANDEKYFAYGAVAWDGLTAGEREQLRQLLFQGPVYDGCVISKSDRNALIGYGLATRCCFMGEQGYTAATYLAYSVHKQGKGASIQSKPGTRG